MVAKQRPKAEKGQRKQVTSMFLVASILLANRLINSEVLSHPKVFNLMLFTFQGPAKFRSILSKPQPIEPNTGATFVHETDWIGSGDCTPVAGLI